MNMTSNRNCKELVKYEYKRAQAPNRRMRAAVGMGRVVRRRQAGGSSTYHQAYVDPGRAPRAAGAQIRNPEICFIHTDFFRLE